MEKSKISLWTIIGIVTVLAITSIFLVIFVPIHLISLWAGFLLGAILVKAKSIHENACNLKIKQDVEKEFNQAISLQEKESDIFHVNEREGVLSKEDNDAFVEETLPELEVKVAVENQKEEALTVTAAPKKKSRKKSTSTTSKTEAKKKNKKKEV